MSRRFRSRVGKLMLVPLSAIGLVGIVGVAPASAACIAQDAWTSTNVGASGQFVIAGAAQSTCNDLNAAKTWTANDYVRGQYRNGAGNWIFSTVGWKFVDTVDDSWIVVISNVGNGTTVRGQTANRSQNVRYVH